MRRLSLLLATIFLLTAVSACGKAPSAGTEEPTVAPVESAPLLSELSEELRAEIEAVWQKQFGKVLKWSEIVDDYEDGTVRYYGIYHGIPVFFQSVMTDAQVAGELKVAGEVFEWGYRFNIYAYKDGNFMVLYLAHYKGHLTDVDIKQIAAVHTYFREAKHARK